MSAIPDSTAWQMTSVITAMKNKILEGNKNITKLPNLDTWVPSLDFTMVQQLAWLPHSSRVPGSILSSVAVCVEIRCMFSLRLVSFHPPKLASRWTGPWCDFVCAHGGLASHLQSPRVLCRNMKTCDWWTLPLKEQLFAQCFCCSVQSRTVYLNDCTSCFD